MKAVTVFNLKTNILPNIPSISTIPAINKFQKLLNQTENILFKASTLFPFDLFPDEISIDGHKVNVVIHEFFLSNDIHSISIEMIRDIQVDTGPFLASLTIIPDGYPAHPIIVNNLKKKDAIKAQKIIQGLMLIKRQRMNTSNLTPSDSIDLERLGHTHLKEW